MAYLGRVKPTETTSSVLRSTYTGDGSTTTYNLPGPVSDETAIIATINGVTQQDAAYTTNGSQIIFSGAPASGDSIELRTISAVAMSYAPMDGSVVTGKIADGAVTSGKLASGAAVANIGARAIATSQVPAGSVIQVVSYTIPTSFSTNSTSFVSTGLQASITPSSTSSKILISVTINGGHKAGGSSVAEYAYYALYSFVSGGSASILKNIAIQGNISNGSNGGDVQSGTISANYLDSPGTTTQMTYVVYAKSSGTTIYFSEAPGEGRWASTVTLMEIAA